MTDEENKPHFEQTETNLHNENEDELSYPERHGCVTAWLILMIITNSVCALVYLFTAGKLSRLLDVPTYMIFALFVIGALNVIFAAMLFSWRKVAFYGFGVTAVIVFVLNISMHISLIKSIIGLAGFAILYGILQIKKNGVSAWDYLK